MKWVVENKASSIRGRISGIVVSTGDFHDLAHPENYWLWETTERNIWVRGLPILFRSMQLLNDPQDNHV